MADEVMARADGKERETGNAAEESSGDRMQNGTQVSDWKLSSPARTEPEAGRDTEARQFSSTAPRFSLKMFLQRSSTSASSTTDALSPSQQSSMGVDCAGIVLSCLFCRFYDLILMLPDGCRRAANHCCPSYKQVVAAETPASSDDESYVDLDCGLLSSCNDANDCLELAMEISELCYH